ncbi:MAG: choice-of-anchor D domain-containing protein [Caldisericia bacterium]|nr:choice-of-anchor D domain-containing protein [Caldisericia bacterium]
MKRTFSIITIFAIAFGMLFVGSPTKKASAIVKKMVLVEQFTATWCGYCPDASETIDALYSRYGEKDFILLKHHSSNGGDPMGNSFANSRMAKLSVGGFPSFYIDTKKCPGRDTDTLQSQIKKSKARGSSCEISVEQSSISDNTVTFKIEYSKLPDRAEIYYCLAEDFIYAKGSNGEKRHRFVSRTGGTVKVNDTKGIAEVTVEIDPDWSVEMLRAYAWIESRIGIENSSYFAFGQKKINASGAVIASYPNEIDFGQMKQNGKATTNLNIRNCGSKSETVSIECNETFFKLNKNFSLSALSETKAKLSINTKGLDPGTYRGILSINGSTYKKSVPFKLQVLHTPKIQIDLSNVDFGEVKRGSGKSKEFTVNNIYDGPISGSISSSEKWLRTSPRSFSENKTKCKIHISTSKLSSGAYTGTINIKSDGGDKEITISVVILAAAIVIAPQEIDFGTVIDTEAKEAKESITISNTGDAKAEVSIEQVPTFIKIDTNEEFSLEPGEEKKISVSINTKKLKIATFKDTLIFKVEKEEFNVPVKLEIVEAPAELSIECDSLKEDTIYVTTDSDPIEVKLSMLNIGAAKMSGSVEIDGPWLTASVTSFSILGNRKKTVKLMFDPQNAKTGENNGFIMITSNGGDLKIPVTFNYTKEPVIIRFVIGNKTVLINGEPKIMEASPFISKGRTVVPIRIIAEAFGAKIDWDGKTQTITITQGKNEISMSIGKPIATVNGEKVILDTAPVISSGRTFVPLRFIAEAFGAKIDWDGKTQTITITY